MGWSWLLKLAKVMVISDGVPSAEPEVMVSPTREEIQALNAFYHEVTRARLTQ
jgi:hypothetical protein